MAQIRDLQAQQRLGTQVDRVLSLGEAILRVEALGESEAPMDAEDICCICHEDLEVKPAAQLPCALAPLF